MVFHNNKQARLINLTNNQLKMSFQNNKFLTNAPNGAYNKGSSSTAIKPFCNVCKAAGKEYNNHFTRSKPGPDGVIVCPHLLSIECGYCHEKGHTPKYCPKSKAKMEREQYYPTTAVLKTPERSKPAFIPSAPARPTQKQSTMFDCLDLDEDEVIAKPVQLSSKHKTSAESLAFPALVPLKQKPKQVPVSSMWAQMAAKPAPIEKPEFDYERKRAIELAKEEQYQKEKHIKRCNRIATHEYSELAQKAVEEHAMEAYMERQNSETMDCHGDDEIDFDDNWTWY